MDQVIAKIIAYMEAHRYTIDRDPGEINIVYVEGMNLDGALNSDRLDQWNDLRLLISFVDGSPRLLHKARSTTEPGRTATFSKKSKALGGVARIAFGQYEAWKPGWHKGQKALVQCAPIPVYRDRNQDGLRTGDRLDFATGINQHSTRLGWTGERIGNWSEGCLVGWNYAEHIHFLDLVHDDPRLLANKNFVFKTAIIPGDQLLKINA